MAGPFPQKRDKSYLPDLDLGIVQLNDNMTSAFIFGRASLHDAPPAWLLAKRAPGIFVFHGIGPTLEQQVEVVELEKTKSDKEEKMREKKGKRGKVAFQQFWGNQSYVTRSSFITCMDASISAS